MTPVENIAKVYAERNQLKSINTELLEACRFAIGCFDNDIRDYADNLPKKLRAAIAHAEA